MNPEYERIDVNKFNDSRLMAVWLQRPIGYALTNNTIIRGGSGSARIGRELDSETTEPGTICK